MEPYRNIKNLEVAAGKAQNRQGVTKIAIGAHFLLSLL